MNRPHPALPLVSGFAAVLALAVGEIVARQINPGAFRDQRMGRRGGCGRAHGRLAPFASPCAGHLQDPPPESEPKTRV